MAGKRSRRALLRCEVSKGQFSTELAMRFRDYNKVMLSLFANKMHVEHNCWHLSHEFNCVGWLRVDVVHEKDDLYMVKLPAETFEQGRFVTVRGSELRKL